MDLEKVGHVMIISRLSIEVEKGLMEDNWTLVVFLDISSAYDNVNRKILIEKLDEKNVQRK